MTECGLPRKSDSGLAQNKYWVTQPYEDPTMLKERMDLKFLKSGLFLKIIHDAELVCTYTNHSTTIYRDLTTCQTLI